MKIQNINNTSSTSFNGYDARPLKGIIMNTNYAHIADMMREIGKIEDFKIFLFQQKNNKTELVNDCFELSNSKKGFWMQDVFGIIKNSILSCENCEKKDIIKNLFHLENNKIENEAQEIMGLDNQKAIVDYMFNLPKIQTSKGERVIFNDGKRQNSIPIEEFNQKFNQELNLLDYISTHTHIKGGNYFITKGKDGTEEVLIGQNELKKYSMNELQSMFDTDKIHPIPLADYHLDLFIRPLKDKKVLIADDNMMYKILSQGLDRIVDQTQYYNFHQDKSAYLKAFKNLWQYVNDFSQNMTDNKYAKMEKVKEALSKAGYEPIPVPGRLYHSIIEEKPLRCTLKHDLNYLNAQTLINSKGEVIYITNKSNIDEQIGLTPKIIQHSGFSLEKAATDAIKPYVDKFYEIGGDNNAIGNEILPKLYGGIHCMGAEVPL
jgi:N-dimethylarginine dimethylaminohydrolase